MTIFNVMNLIFDMLGIFLLTVVIPMGVYIGVLKLFGRD